MLPVARRIRRDSEHRHVFKRGRLIRGQYLTARIAPGQGQTHRFGFIVGTKTSKRATERNTIKRRLRAIAPTVPLPPTPPLDIVVTALTTSVKATFHQLSDDFRSLLSGYAPRHR